MTKKKRAGISKVVANNPNTIIGGLGGGMGLGTAVVWALNHWNGYSGLSDYWKTATVGAVTSVILFIGRNGFVGTWNFVKNIVLHGTGK